MIAHSSLFHRARGAALAGLALSMAAVLPAGAVPLNPGNLYVSNYLDNTIERFTPAGLAASLGRMKIVTAAIGVQA